MNPKRKPFIWISGFFAFALFVLSAVILGVALNNTLSKIRRIVISIVDEWQVTLGKIIFLGIFTAILGLYTLWSVIRARKKNKVVAIVVLLGHCLALGAGIYVVLMLDKIHAAPSKSQKEMFQLVNQLVKDGRRGHQNPHFVPPWMDNIQKHDPHCCGIETFRDWETFWGGQEKSFPKTCCRPSRLNCTTSVRSIIYPDLLSQNIKTEGGCYALIVSKVKAIILEAKKFCSILTVGIGLSLAATAALYVVVFFLKKSSGGGQDDEYDSDDDGTGPRIPTGELTWRNLEFYRVLVKGKPKKDQTLGQATGSYSANPMVQFTSSTFQPTVSQMQQDPQQVSPVQYRVDVLSASTVQLPSQVAVNDPPPTTQTQPPVTINPQPVVVDTTAIDSTGFGTSAADDVEDQIRRNVQPPPRKRLHRHRHRRDYQENEVVDNSGAGSPN